MLLYGETLDRLCVHLKMYLLHIKLRCCTEITDGGQSWPPQCTFIQNVTSSLADITKTFIKSHIFKIEKKLLGH